MSFRISHVYAFISLDPSTDEEGVRAFQRADSSLWARAAPRTRSV